jgi:hypothetical protein
MGGFFSSPESNSSVQVEEMGASGSKANATVGTAAAPRMNGVNKNVEAGEAGNRMNVSAMAPRTNRANNNVEMGTTQRVNTNGSDPGTPGRNNGNNGNNRNKSRRNNAAINVNRLKNVVVEEPPQENASTKLQGENMAGGRRRHRKGSRKASRKQGHKSRRH